MAAINDLATWVPQKIPQVINDGRGFVVENTRWNELWNLTISQGNWNADAVRAIITAAIDDKAFLQGQITANLGLLQTHQTSADHDGRYYTEPETDALLTALKGVGYTTETLAGLGVLSTSLQSQINNIIATYSTDAERIAAFQEVVNQFKSADQDIINMILAKANIADVYTKVQIDAKEFATANYAARSVTAEKIALQAVGVEHIKTGAVGADQLNPSLLENVVLTQHRGLSDLDHPDSSVMTKHVRAKAVTTDKVADKAITVAQLGDDVLAIDTPYTTTFNSNTYSITTRAGYVSGNPLAFVASADSTGAVSLSVDGVVSPLLKANGGAVTNLKNNGLYTARKNGSNFTLQGEGGEYGTAIASKVLSPYTIGTEGGLVTGTMPNRAGENAALANSVSGTTLKLRAPEGYYDGVDDMVTHVDANRIASNIKQGVTLDGILGTLPDGTSKKMKASGSITIASEGTINISGLGFTPSLVVVYMLSPLTLNDRWAVSTYIPAGYPYYNGGVNLGASAKGNYTNTTGQSISSGCSVYNGGFSLKPISSTDTMTWAWIAYE